MPGVCTRVRHIVTSNRSRCLTILSAALPSHFGGIVPFFHCPAINRASAGGSLLGSVPMSSLVPIVMVSANAHDNDLEKRLRAGCDDFLVKPVIATELLNKLPTHLGLDWKYRSVALEAPADTIETLTAPVLPSHDQILDLQTLGAIGYVKGILDKLDEIERADNRHAAFTSRLRARVKGFRLEEYSRLLDQMVSNDATRR